MNHNERVIYRALLTLLLMPLTVIGWFAAIPALTVLLVMEESPLKDELMSRVLDLACFSQILARKIIPEPKEEDA